MPTRSRRGSWRIYDPVVQDLIDPPLGARMGYLVPGDRVRVVTLKGCPCPSGHALIETEDGRFAGMVRSLSLKCGGISA